MATTEQRYSLKWNNYQSHLITSFETLLDEKEFVDVTLGCEGRKLPAHRMLLSACSPYFHDLLKDNLCTHPIIVLQDIPYDNLTALLQFIYNGEVSVSQDQLSSFLRTAESLKIKGLTEGSESNRDSNLKYHENDSSKSRKRPSTDSAQVNSSAKQIARKPIISTPTKVQANKNSNKPQHSQVKSSLSPASNSTNNLSSNLKQEVIDYEESSEMIDNLSYDNMEQEENYDDDDPSAFNSRSFNDDISHAGPSDPNIDPIGSENESQDFEEEEYDDYIQFPMLPLTKDFKTVRTIDGEFMFECDECDKRYKTKNAMLQHRKCHKGLTTCKICGRVLSNTYNLKVHMTAHQKYHEKYP